MALFRRKSKRVKTQNKYQDYFKTMKKRGELRSALTYAQWLKAGKPKPKYLQRKTRKVSAELRKAGLKEKDIARVRD